MTRPASPRRSVVRPRRLPEPHAVLGLPPSEQNPVRVIEVAHVLLRRWRFVCSGHRIAEAPLGSRKDAIERIRQILEARSAMLERIHTGSRRP